MRYIGFDMGDGESAVTVYESGSGIEPVVRPVGGSRSFLTAVGTANGEIVVGEQAYTDALATDLRVRFKSRFTFDAASGDAIRMFVRGVLATLPELGTAEDRFVVGCPAGWNAACRARYRDVLLRAGMPDPRVISESRAAFLYAKYARTVALDVDVLGQSALVIDVGSSTLDFAYIVGGRETGVGTFGDERLGGGLLDEALLRRAVELSRDRDRLNEVFSKSRSWYGYCEIAARRVKEQYFSQAATESGARVTRTLRVSYDGVQRLTIALDDKEAERLIHEPLEALEGVSFAARLRTVLQGARDVTAEAPPKLVLLTGGASRMGFLQQQCREVFTDAMIVCCPEPEFSIAKGLAYAGWVDDNLSRFREAIRAEITDERVRDVARNALGELTPGVADAMAALLTEEVAIPVMRRWKDGELATLQEASERMQQRAERVLASPMAEEALAPVIGVWIAGLSGELQALVDPICDRYHVPREEMRLHLAQSAEAASVRFGGRELMDFRFVNALVGVVLSVLGAILCGGGGLALVSTGPVGFLAGALIGAVVALLGQPAVTAWLMRADLPKPLRLMDVESRLRGDAARVKIRAAISRELAKPDGAFAIGITQGFTEAFQRYLSHVAQAAEIPIQ